MVARRTRRRLACACAALCLLAACGKRNAPLPPLLRVPGPVNNLAAGRFADEVFVRFGVPTANVDGVTPGDVARVEVYAITLTTPPTAQDDPDDLRKISTLIGAETVARPIPVPPPAKPGAPPIPAPPAGPGVPPGTVLVFRESLTPQTLTPVTLPKRGRIREPEEETGVEPLPGPIVPLPETEVSRRYYYAVALSARGRYGPIAGFVPVPLGPTSGAPSQPVVTYTEKALTVSWNPPADARGVRPPDDPLLLPARPTVPGPEPTTYDVYDVTPGNATPAAPAMPQPINAEPLAPLTLEIPTVAFGTLRCFAVRAVDIVGGVHVRGPQSAETCETPVDTFPPATPATPDAVATTGQINLIWDQNSETDLAGYLVLRGIAGQAGALTPLTTAPARESSFSDTTVKPGVRYVYAIVAVDNAGNRSAESARVEETAR